MAYIPIDFGTNSGNKEKIQKPPKYIPIEGLPNSIPQPPTPSQSFTITGYSPVNLNKSSIAPYSNENIGQQNTGNWLMDHPNVLYPLAGIQESVKNIPKSFLGDIKSIPQDAISPLVNAWNGITDAAANAIVKFKSKGRTTSEKIAAVGDLLSAAANAAFLPITETFNVAKDIPVVGGVTNLIALPFEIAGAGGSIALTSALNALPLSQQDKNNLMNTASTLGALAGQIALGFGMEKAAALKAMKDTSTELLDRKQAGETITPKIAEDTLKRKIDEVKKETKPKAIKPNEVKPVETKSAIKPQVIKPNAEIPKELEPLAEEARKYKSAEEFVKAIKANPEKIPISPEYKKFLSEKDTFTNRENQIFAEMKAMRDKYIGKTINEVPPEDIAKYENLQKELNQTLSKKTLAEIPEGVIKIHIGEKGLETQLTDFYNQVTKGVKEVKPEIMSIEEYLDKKGIPEFDYSMQTTKGGRTVREQKRVEKQLQDILYQQNKAIEEYYDKVKKGEIIPPPKGELVMPENIIARIISELKLKLLQQGEKPENVEKIVNQKTAGIEQEIKNLEKQGINPLDIEKRLREKILGEKGIKEVKPETKIEIPEPTQPTKTIELTSGLNPRLDKFIEQDIKPTAKATLGGVKSAFKTLKDLFVPTKSSEEAVKTASILRTELAKQAREKELLYHKISDARKVFDRYTPEQAIDFIDKIETGKPIDGAENFAKVIRDAFDSRWNKIKDIKGTDAYIENYFPHLWKDPEKASETLAKYFGKRPLEGTKSFLKQRKIPTLKEGVELGLEPISYNPVDLVMARIADMDKFIMAHNVVDAFKKEGLMKFVRFGEKPPEGWVKINDKIGEVYQFSEAEKGFIKRGDYYMPKDAARIVNNYLSPGLLGNPIYDVIRKAGNIMTQANLGLSFFHGLFTTNDAMISKFALGLQQLSRGEIKKFIKTSLETPTYSFRNVIHGNKLLEDYFKENPQIPELVDALIKAGGRVRMDSFYKNSAVESFLKALRSENYLGAAVRTPGALIEEVAKPILQELVPRQKLGVFMDLAKDILEQAKKEDWSDTKTTLRLQEAWDSVDNRLGELVYDNLFWNKALKDLSMASVRAVGWNLGTIRELGGGLKDIASIPYKLITGGEIRMTPRMAYTIALPLVVGVEGAILHYLLTGKPPETLLDYYYPKTDRKNPDGTDERISLPSYMKDVFAVGKEGALKVASNKLNPIFGTIIDMLQNKDYYGTEIRNTNDPLVKQIAQEFQFLASQFEPFSIQSAIRGQSPLAKYGSFFGLTVAPSYITKTPLEKKIMGMYEYRFGKETQTKGQKERQDFLNQIRKAYMAGDQETANKLLQEAEQKGYFTTKAVESKFVGDSDLPSGVRMFRRLPSEDQEKLLKDMNLAELNQYAWYASEKVKSKLSSLSENAKQFVEMVNNGEIKKPIWKAGKIINQ